MEYKHARTRLRYSFIFLTLIMLFSSCKEKTLIYSTQVLDEVGNPVLGARVDVIRNDVLLKRSKTMTPTHEEVIMINEEEMYYPIVSDSIGMVNVVFTDEHFLSPDQITLKITKDGYRSLEIDLEWGASVGNKIWIVCIDEEQFNNQTNI